MDAHPIEKEIGINTYLTRIPGVGGKLRTNIEDFIVEEITSEGKVVNLLTKNDINLKNLPEYHFTYNLVLEKHNLETFSAIRTLASFLQIPYKNVGFAGLKDKRAITSQCISISGADPRLLMNLQRKGAYTGAGIYVNRIQPGKPIRLGNLNGNAFTITIRQIHQPTDEVQLKLNQINQEILSSSLPNYYGPQRFGSIRPISHKVGRALLIDDFETALKIYLTAVFPQEDKSIQEIRIALRDSWPLVNITFPKGYYYENKLIQYLKAANPNFKKIFKKIFYFRFILLFIHAYQSYLFNLLLNARIKADFPLNQAFEGDHVSILDQYSLPTKVIYEVNSKNINFLNNAISKKKAIVMAPLFGYNLDYSHHPLSDEVAQILDEEKLDLSLFKSSIEEKMHLKVVYRPIIFIPKELSYTLNQAPNNSQNISVTFSFSLNKGTYATLLLREFMKTSPLNY